MKDGLRVAGCALRVAGCALRVERCELRVTRCGSSDLGFMIGDFGLERGFKWGNGVLEKI